ncbi:Glycosyl transferase group 1 [Croceitalea dokdonensis DOKDO 023]|uniref:Glycosyl transferase group 1 n=1 Tax=Croceitalea dokdonensis DOKDO 023 TaxID=1300341 RepID=A0A0P7AI14_9FLAO|nr:glycosyltransferase family 4 protein [Croceitalea dokdonensis]KPM33257.1 Glycosyl transferase group 1 [Croceitalea dokdonensis DOKDO 023]
MQKVLIICYYWPPAGGPGVQRWLKFVKYLPEFGFEPLVYVPENPNYPMIDDSLVNEVPKGLRVIKQPIFEPYQLASFLSEKKTKRISSGLIPRSSKQSFLERLMLWVRGNLFIPDARKFWVGPSVEYLSDIIRKESITTIITTGPPHSVHLIGLKIRQLHQLKWVADFRDPWTSIGYHKKLKLTKASQKKHQLLEKAVLENADHIITTSKTTKKEFASLSKRPITVITNGFDGELVEVALDDAFSIAHIGSLLTDRNPELLWELLQELCEEIPKFREQLSIQLIGVVGDAVKASIAKYGLVNQVSFLGYVPHKTVLHKQRQSQVLLLLEIDAPETVGIIPGKLFEYMHANRPILAIGPKHWEAADIISDTKSGKCLVSGDREGLKKALLEYYKAFQKNQLRCTPTGIVKYSRRELTRRLANTLEWES